VPAQVVRVRIGGASRRALTDAIASVKRSDALAPVIVLTPTARSAIHLRRVVASERLGPGAAGVANVTFVTADRLAEALGSSALELAGRRHLTRSVLHAACRRVLAEHPELFGIAGEHPSTSLEIVARYEELRVAGDGALAVLAGRGPAASALATVASEIRRLVARGYYDDVELLESASEAVRRDGGAAAPGVVVVYLPERIRPAEATLFTELGARRDVLVLLGSSGDPAADAVLEEREAILGLGPAAPAPAERATAEQASAEPASAAPGTAVPFAELLVATDPVAEVRAAVRVVVGALAAGTRAESVAVVYPNAVPYAGLLAGELGSAGIAWGGPSPTTLASAPSSRVLTSLLSMRPDRVGRRALVGLLGSSALRPELADGVRPGEWDRVTRLLGLAEAGIGEWRDRTAELLKDADRGLDPLEPGQESDDESEDRGGDRAEPVVPSGRDQASRRTRTAAAALVGVLDLVEQLSSVAAQLRGYAALGAWALGALEQLLGPEETRASEGPGADSDHQLVGLLVELSGIAGLDDDVDLQQFGRVVVSELDRPGPQRGRLGSGVVVGPIEQAFALDLDLVVLLGCAEGNLPGRAPTSALLSAADREAVGLPDERGVEARDRRRVLIGCASGRRAIATTPLVDPRSGRPATRSRFSADVETVTEVPRVEQLLELVAAGLLPVDTEELECALLLPVGRAGFGASSHFVARRHEVLGRGLVALETRRAQAFGPYSGRVGPHDYSSPRDRAVSPTSLEEYAVCPFRYLVSHVLGCEVLEEPEHRLTIDPRDRGTIVHEALERYMREMIGGRHEGLDSAGRAARLAGIGREIFARFDRYGRTGRRVPSELERRRVLRMLEGERVRDEAHRAETGTRPLAVEHLFGFGTGAPVSFAVGDHEVAFRGRIDRIDEAPDGLEVLDYKTGSSYGYRGLNDDPVDRGRHLQLPVYALAGAAYGIEAGEAPTAVRAAFRFVGPDPMDIPFLLDGPGRSRFAEALGTILDGIAEGAFPFHPGDLEGSGDSNCRYCDFDALCPRDRAATWQRAALAPALGAYLALAEPGALGEAATPR